MRQASKYDSGACDAGGGLKGVAPVLPPRLGRSFRGREWGCGRQKLFFPWLSSLRWRKIKIRTLISCDADEM